MRLFTTLNNKTIIITENQLKQWLNGKNLVSEAKLDALRKYHPNIDDETFQMIAKADPKWKETKADTAGGYTKWLLDLYEKDPSMVRRLRQISDDLREYNPNMQPDRALISQVADDKELHDRVKSLYGKKEASKQEGFNKDIVYRNNEGWIVVVPSSFSSSRYWGQGTHWCTASEDDHYYKNYTSEGPLYIIINTRTNEKWQFHKPSESYMDAEDDSVNPYDIGLPDDVIDFLTEHDAIELTDSMNVRRNGVEVKKVNWDEDSQCYDFFVETPDRGWSDWFYLQVEGCSDVEIDYCSVYGSELDGYAFERVYNIIMDYAETFGLIAYNDEEDNYYFPNKQA